MWVALQRAAAAAARRRRDARPRRVASGKGVPEPRAADDARLPNVMAMSDEAWRAKCDAALIEMGRPPRDPERLAEWLEGRDDSA